MVHGETLANKLSKVWVNVTEKENGALFFEVKQTGFELNQLAGVYFAVNDKGLLNSLRVESCSEIVRCQKNTRAMRVNETHAEEYIELDDQRYDSSEGFINNYNFILKSTARDLVLSDFTNIQLDCAKGNDPGRGDDLDHEWLYMGLA